MYIIIFVLAVYDYVKHFFANTLFGLLVSIKSISVSLFCTKHVCSLRVKTKIKIITEITFISGFSVVFKKVSIYISIDNHIFTFSYLHNIENIFHFIQIPCK